MEKVLIIGIIVIPLTFFVVKYGNDVVDLIIDRDAELQESSEDLMGKEPG